MTCSVPSQNASHRGTAVDRSPDQRRTGPLVMGTRTMVRQAHEPERTSGQQALTNRGRHPRQSPNVHRHQTSARGLAPPRSLIRLKKERGDGDGGGDGRYPGTVNGGPGVG